MDSKPKTFRDLKDTKQMEWAWGRRPYPKMSEEMTPVVCSMPQKVIALKIGKNSRLYNNIISWGKKP